MLHLFYLECFHHLIHLFPFGIIKVKIWLSLTLLSITFALVLESTVIVSLIVIVSDLARTYLGLFNLFLLISLIALFNMLLPQLLFYKIFIHINYLLSLIYY